MKKLIIKTLALAIFGFFASEYSTYNTLEMLSLGWWGGIVIIVNMVCMMILLIWD